jgi:hypothetical protein
VKPHQKKAQKRLEREAKAKGAAARRDAGEARQRARAEALRSRVREVKAPPEVQAIIRAQLAAFVERFGRNPRPGEHLFFDPGAAPELGPMVMPESAIEAVAEKLGAPVELVGALVRSGLLVRNAPTETGRTSSAAPNVSGAPREA